MAFEMTLKGREGKEHCTVNSGVNRHNSLGVDSYGNDDEEVQNRFHNASSLEFGGAQLQRVSRDRSVGIATRYGVEGPGIESRLGRDFPHLSRPAPVPTQPPVQWAPVLSRG
jgi:hypothetical protein